MTALYTVFPIDFFVVLAVVVPSRRQQTLIINMFRQKQETSVLIGIYHNRLHTKYSMHQPVVVDRLRSASSKGQVYYVDKSLFGTVVGIGSGLKDRIR